MFWQSARLPTRGHLWWWAGAAATLALLVVLFTQLDFAAFFTQLRNAAVSIVALAMLCFLLEATLTAYRIKLFAGRQATLWQATVANGWYVLLVLVLPARLGEVAAVAVFERYLQLPRGAAVASIVAQRLFDIIVIAILFVVASLWLIDVQTDITALPWTALVVALAIVCVLKLEFWLNCVNRLLHGPRRPTSGVRRTLLRLTLQARSWHQRFQSPGRSLWALLVTAIKWVATMGGIALAIYALNLPLTAGDAFAASAVYNFSAIIPIHTVGGLGLGEVGLTAILVSMGLILSVAIGTALFVRLVLILFTVAYFAIVAATSMVISRRGG